MKKKYSAISKEKSDWIAFTKKIDDIYDKDAVFDQQNTNTNTNKIRKLDLHGFSLNEANKIFKKFTIESINHGCKKILVITGKGLRSKARDDPYSSEKMSVLKYSIPEFIKNDEDLSNKISSISTKAEPKDGGEGAFYIFLKRQKNL